MSKIIYGPKEKYDYGKEEWRDIYKKTEDLRKILLQQNTDAMTNDTLLGRLLSHPYADGAAYYVVTKVNKKTVRIHVVFGLGDDWVLPAWGHETSIPIHRLDAFLYH